MERRDLLKLSLAAAGFAVLPASASESCPAEGTPAQFMPKNKPDPKPLERDIEKFQKCPYCGMDRKQFHATRMLVHYSDDLADGTCSLHCAAISLSLNVDREPKEIYVADNASDAGIKPLIEAGKASFLIGSQLKGVMTKRSKIAYGSEAAAKESQAANGGELANFDQALLAAYTDMSQDVSMVRKNREERRKRAQNRGS